VTDLLKQAGVGTGDICFAHLGLCLCFRPCISPAVCPRLRIPQYLHLLIGFRQTFFIGAFWDKDKLIMFWGQKVESQGHVITAEASSIAFDAAVEFTFLFW